MLISFYFVFIFGFILASVKKKRGKFSYSGDKGEEKNKLARGQFSRSGKRRESLCEDDGIPWQGLSHEVDGTPDEGRLARVSPGT